MIPHGNDDERQPGEQAAIPLLEEKRTSPPAPWWRSRTLLQRAIGVLVLFVVGLAAPTSTTAVGAGFFAVLGAAWLNSWWACLIVPLALVTGYALRQLLSAGFELNSIVLVALFACFGAILGTVFFKWRDVRRWIRGKSY